MLNEIRALVVHRHRDVLSLIGVFEAADGRRPDFAFRIDVFYTCFKADDARPQIRVVHAQDNADNVVRIGFRHFRQRA